MGQAQNKRSRPGLAASFLIRLHQKTSERADGRTLCTASAPDSWRETQQVRQESGSFGPWLNRLVLSPSFDARHDI